jgi:hypothetical protein
LVYASAYLKVHFPTVFYVALLNNQPMGFYHPATLIRDAQRRGIKFQEINVQRSDWLCTVEEEGVIRLGLRYVLGLRESVGQLIQPGNLFWLLRADWINWPTDSRSPNTYLNPRRITPSSSTVHNQSERWTLIS